MKTEDLREYERMTDLERALEFQLKAAGHDFVTEHQFHPTRKWRFDFAEPARKVAAECEGGVWTRGRHTRGAGFEKDVEKYNEAAILGWTVIRGTRKHVDSGEMLEWIERALSNVTG